MPTVRYTTVNGEVIAEKRGGVRKLYVPDPLGSTVALLDNTQAQTDTFSYWPYGETRTHNGTTPTPLMFVGTRGYYSDSINLYIRARYMNVNLSRFLSKVRFEEQLENEHPYGYSGNNPTTYIDPSGNQAQAVSPPPYKFDPGFWNSGNIQTNNNCYCYALNYPCGDRACQPGDFSGYRFNNCPHGKASCQNLLANAIRDGMRTVPSSGCPVGWHKVVLFVGTDSGSCAWHWYRQEIDGSWSNKESAFPITNCYINFFGGDDAGIGFSDKRIQDPSIDAPKHGTPKKWLARKSLGLAYHATCALENEI